MSLPSGQSYAAGGGGSPGVPSSAWGYRPDLSVGGPTPGPNMAMAAQNAPNSPPWLQQQLAGYYAAPMMSPNGVSDYGRWNWLRQPGAQPYANRMQTQSYQPQQPNVQPQSASPTQPQPTTPGAPDPWVSGQTPMQLQPAQPSTPRGPQIVPGVTPSWYDPSKDQGLAMYQPGYQDTSGGVGSAGWWGAVRGDIQNQNPSANIPSWLRG